LNPVEVTTDNKAFKKLEALFILSFAEYLQNILKLKVFST